MKALESKDLELSTRNSISKSGTLTNDSGINYIGNVKDMPKTVLTSYNLVETKKLSNEELEKYVLQQIKNKENMSNFSPISQKQQNTSEISDISFTNNNNTHSNNQPLQYINNSLQELSETRKSQTPQFTNQILVGMTNSRFGCGLAINQQQQQVILMPNKETPGFNSPVNFMNNCNANNVNAPPILNNNNNSTLKASKDLIELESTLQSTYNYQQNQQQQFYNNPSTSAQKCVNELSASKNQQLLQQPTCEKSNVYQHSQGPVAVHQQKKIHQLASQSMVNSEQREPTPESDNLAICEKSFDKERSQLDSRSGRFEYQNSNNFSRSSSNKENVFRQNSPSGFNNWRDSNSPAIAGAIKTLQEKVKKLEQENFDLKKQNQERDPAYKQMMENLKKQQEAEIVRCQQGCDKLKQQLTKSEEENNKLQQAISKMNLDRQLLESESGCSKKELAKAGEVIKQLQQEILYQQKCMQIIEDEKLKHLEQNAIEKDQFEEQQSVLVRIRDANKTLIEKLETDLSSTKKQIFALNEKCQHFEAENAHTRKKLQVQEEEFSNREKLHKNKIQQLEREITQISEKMNSERQALQKKATVIDSYEEKIKTLKEEKRESTKDLLAVQQVANQLQKNQELLEKSLQRALREKQTAEENFKKVLEINEELTNKCIKECPQKSREQIYSIANKIKKLDQSKLRQSQQQYQDEPKKSAKKSGRSKSKSPRSTSLANINKSNKKKVSKALQIEDLSDTPDQLSASNSINSRSSSCRQKLKQLHSGKKVNCSSIINESVNYNEGGSILESQVTPQNLKQKKRMLCRGSSTKRSALSKSHEKKKSDRSQSKTDRHQNSTLVEEFSNPNTKTNANVFKNLNEFNPQNVVESNVLKSNSSQIYDKMSEAELSSEIIKIERGLMEMKREYKNLLAKTQEDNVENVDNLRQRLSELANEMQQKTEMHGLLKSKQRQLITQSFSKNSNAANQ